MEYMKKDMKEDMKEDIQDIDDDDFLKNIGKKIGSGHQGDVYNFLPGTVVKKWRHGTNVEIKNEINNSIIASECYCGPENFDFRKIKNIYYMVMEKVEPVKLYQEDYAEIISLFKKIIENNIINNDGSFGRTKNGKLVMFDYGVSEIANDPKETRKKYCNDDYFYLFDEIYGVEGLQEYFCREKSPSPRKSPRKSPRRSPRRSRKRKDLL